MRDDDLLSLRHAEGGAAVMRARRLVGAIARRVGDPARARRLEAELNDAWLRLQFALVTADAGLIRAERRACARLLREAGEAQEEGAARAA